MINDYNDFMKNSNEMLVSMLNNLKDLEEIELDSLESNKTLLSIIDMNNGFAKEGALYSERVERLIPKIEKLTRTAIADGITTVAINDTHYKESPEFECYPVHCMHDSQECKLIDELSQIKGLSIVGKNSTNGIIKMLPSLTKGRFRTFIVVGCVTDICVYQYTISLKAYLNENNIRARIILPIDCVDTFDIPGVHDAEFMNVVYLNSLISNGVEVVKSIKVK